MNIMDKALSQSQQIWEDCVKTDFLQEMMGGVLSKEKFLNYIIQDSIYLLDYLKAYAMAIVKSKTFRQMQTFYSVLGFVNDSENVTRLKFLNDNGMTDDDVEKIAKLPECAAYTNFLVTTAMNEEIPEILMAVMPCMIGYYIVFDKVKCLAPHLLCGEYGGLIQDYSSEMYAESCKVWTQFINEQCANLDAQRTNRLLDIFMQASNHELEFWKMSGR